jgi:uncharacterized membrane protein YeaQ/YmgE (transglycosylase-associated protein family)
MPTTAGAAILSILETVTIMVSAGWVAAHIVKGRGLGVWIDLLLGIAGALLGARLFSFIGVSASGFVGRLVTSTTGAVALLLVVRVLRRA